MEDYIKALKAHDWYYEYSDDHSVWTRGRASKVALNAMQLVYDKAYAIWNQHCPKDLQIKPVSTSRG